MIGLVMLMILTLPTRSVVANAKGSTKKNITIKAGQKKKINLKISKIKKIKVKSSKKSVASVKTIGKKKIQITGKKAGKATITVKVTTKNKKVKTIKYKVTVKKKASTPKSTEQEDTEAATTEEITPPMEVKSTYSYELKIMNTKTLYNDTKVVIYIKTNNPNLSSITADCGTKKAIKHKDESGIFYTYEDEFQEVVEPNNYADVTYMDKAYGVSGGYLRTYRWDTAGVKNLTLYETIGTTKVKVAKLAITLQDKTQAENVWVKAVMD